METTTLITLIVPIITAVLGYFLREWQNYFKPFTKIISFEGDFFSGSSSVEVNNSICNSLKSSLRIHDLNGSSLLADVKKARDGARSTKEIVPDILSSIDNVTDAIKKHTTNEQLFELLKNVFSGTYLDDIIFQLYVNGNLNVFPIQSNSCKEIKCAESNHVEGSFLLTFGNKNYMYIGNSFSKNELLKTIFSPIKEMVINMDRNAISNFLSNISFFLRKELDIATNVLSELDKILDSHSKWESVVYIVNMRNNPILLNNRATLHVKDNISGAMFSESCILALPHKDENGKEGIKPRNVPFLIPKGEHCTCYFFTEKNQSEMNSGETFRSIFNKGGAEAFVELEIESIGLKKKRKVETPKLLFKDYTT